jgi:hypothetical protein
MIYETPASRTKPFRIMEKHLRKAVGTHLGLG